ATRGKHIVIENFGMQRRENFLSTLRGRLATYPRKEAFVFIHGYNVNFAEAALRTAQMAHDLKFEGVPILYSWPSEGALTGYAADEATVEWSQPHLVGFLRDVVTQSDAQVIHIIAHSMGNRPTTKAFLELMNVLSPADRLKVRNLILTAPDIDSDIFREQLAPRLTVFPTRVTLYVSAKDDALSMSRKFHTYSRIGLLEQGKQPPIMAGIETVDVSDVDSSFLGHSYYAEKRSVLEDIFHLVRNDLSARNRYGLKEFRLPGGSYWRMSAEDKK
ncbi:MAG: alpha/beta hydrolase, partial [Magnetococcales bacterium]|nr:alpha/beta hydrolase [Magnetococcales bacterium]